jgi:hypothetical protein
MIIKAGNKYRIVSSKGKKLGEYDTREQALKRLGQIEYFKNKEKKYEEGGPIVPDPKRPGVKEPFMTADLAAALTKAAQQKPLTFEGRVNASLGDPKGRAAEYAGDFGAKDGNGPIDNIRHPLAAAYTAEAVQDKVKSVVGNNPLGNVFGTAVGFAFSNAAGIGHEARALPQLLEEYYKEDGISGVFNAMRMTGEDVFNNFVGSVVGSLPKLSKEQSQEIITYLSLNNLIPDGYQTPDGKENFYFKR